MFHAATAFLPSSFTMLGVLAIWTAWLRGSYGPAIALAVYTILLVWPFAVLLYVPLGLAALFAPEFGLLKVLRWGIGSSLLLGGADMAYNTLFYGKPLLASWEIFYYNVLQDNGGPELYGTEPPSFYAVNLALNFNGAFVLAAALPVRPDGHFLLPHSMHHTNQGSPCGAGDAATCVALPERQCGEAKSRPRETPVSAGVSCAALHMVLLLLVASA